MPFFKTFTCTRALSETITVQSYVLPLLPFWQTWSVEDTRVTCGGGGVGGAETVFGGRLVISRLHSIF